MAIREMTLFRPAPLKGDRARERLFAAAVELFGERGPDGATVREIARAAGQNVAAIAYYFGSKEKLYRAVLEGITEGIRETLGDVRGEMEAFRQKGGEPPAEAGRLLKRFLSAAYLRLLSRDDAVSVLRIIVREQLGPTPAFEILYQRGFRQLHEALCFLVGAALGRPPRERETILRTHMLMGQVYFFAMSREAILRRAGWKSLEGKNAALVVELLEQHLDALLAGLSRQKARAGQRKDKTGL